MSKKRIKANKWVTMDGLSIRTVSKVEPDIGFYEYVDNHQQERWECI